ncbi:hypothetical protein DTO166G4_4673 [Paecilomyces variotii]|nr:hypothetical protein DTO166G4_4673 [Paecilomyces variotii]KAJ9238182.1 hypothetical protein DTO166G5_3084 [Paecilomyces variotii]
MDMPMSSDPAVSHLPLSDPNCIKAEDACIAYYAAANASQDAISWSYQFQYGHWATYYYVIIIGLLFLGYAFTTLTDNLIKNSSTAPRRPSILRKLQALGRSVFYRRIRLSWPTKLFDVPADVGTILFLLATIVFFTALVFAVKPYYREQIGYGSPPIAIRSGLMAFACVPILVALAGKANIVTFFTGISHERLSVLHRWVSWISFALSLFHALPFLVGSARNPIVGGEAMVEAEFYMDKSSPPNEYSGVPPLAILFGICVLSLPYIRDRFYESFYAAHILLVITYFGLLFWHSANTMDSWSYLWAALAIWVASWLTRVFWKTQPLNIRNSWFDGNAATVSIVSADVTRIDVWPSDGFHWKPSQHVFLRFPDIAPLDNHPFTIAIAESASGSPCHLVFLARAHAGFTRKLRSYVQAHHSTDDKKIITSVWLDGPYGGMRRPPHNRYDTLILVAGGTGITACFPWLQDAVARAGKRESDSRIKRVVLVWSMKRPDAIQWLADEFDSLAAANKIADKIALEIRLHITEAEPLTDDGRFTQHYQASSAEATKVCELNVDVASPEKTPAPSSPLMRRVTTFNATIHSGRPIMPTVLRDSVRQGERTMVIGCGPATFRADLGNAVAAAQSRVFRGEIVELAMHLETFGW